MIINNDTNLETKWEFRKKIIKLIVFISLGQMLMTVVSFVDQFMVGRIGHQPFALTAVLVATEILYIAMSFNMGVSILIDLFGAQFYGAKIFDKFKNTINIKLIFNLLIAIILVLVMNFASHALVNIFIRDHEVGGNFHEILDISVVYLRVISISYFFYAISSSFFGSFNIMHKSYIQILTSFTSLLINILFNYIFIYVLNLGVVGAAISTCISRGMELIILIIFIIIFKDSIWFGWKNIFYIDPKLFKKIITRFLIFTNQILFAVGLVAKTAILTNFFPEESNGIGIGYAVAGLLWSVLPSFNSVAKIVIGKEMALQNFERGYRVAKKVLIMSIISGLILGALIMTTAFYLPQIVGIENEPANAAKSMIIIESTIIVFIICEAFIFALLEAGGFSRASTFFNSYYILFLGVPLCFLIIKFSNITFVWYYLIMQLINFMVPFFFTIPLFLRKKWLRNVIN